MHRRDDREPVYAGTPYRKVQDLSCGSSGNVHLARRQDNGEDVAIKFMARV